MTFLEVIQEWSVQSINWASSNGHLEVVKYLYETCHAKITEKTIKNAKAKEIKEYLQKRIHDVKNTK